MMRNAGAAYAERDRDSPAIRPQTLRAWLLAAVLASVAVAASSFRIILVPGIELYLGPLFYLLAYRLGGVRLALPVAAITMLPSYFWWGHVFSIVLALAHVLAIARMPRFRDLAIPTLIFSVFLAAPAGYLFLRFHYGAPDVVIALAVLRKLLNDVLLAAIVDMICAIVGFDLAQGRLFRRRTVRLTRLMPATVSLIILTSTLVPFVNNVGRFSKDFSQARAEASLFAELEIRRSLADHASGRDMFRQVGGDRAERNIIIASRLTGSIQATVKRRLGCTRIDDGAQVSGPNDRNTFAYWLAACQRGKVDVGGRNYYYFYSTRPVAERAYRGALLEMTGPCIILIVSLLLHLFLNRGVEQSLHAWKLVVEALGKPDITKPRRLLFKEFSSPIDAIVAANNRFATLADDRRRLADAVVELKDEMDLKLASDIRFDRETGVLHFTEISIDCPARKETIIVYPSDRNAVAGICAASEAFVEFRIDGGAAPDWFLLSARGLEESGHWRSGWIVRLRQSKLAHDRVLQQARLVELGGMASALSHELKQPLFTIALSSENGRLLIDQATPEAIVKARTKFDRISEQVNRSRDIIARISRYSRIEDDDPNPVEIGEVINTALRFMRPLMVQKNVDVRTELPEPLMVLVSRVGIEQLLVNAIQNSVDAILSRSAAGEPGLQGEIGVSVTVDDDGVRMRITDNGTGMMQSDPESAFGAFVTTKPADSGTGLGLYISRQIVMEMGGRISIGSRPAPERGAVMTVDLPAHLIARRKNPVRGVEASV
ncbi:ATP-binding protein [Sphingomonas sp. RT2P30]|uniref:sensor histidine kinase n=1 Tax=Parasphingomonas halimpatiens TaxID=3096162 RepID=UPI002FCB07A4